MKLDLEKVSPDDFIFCKDIWNVLLWNDNKKVKS